MKKQTQAQQVNSNKNKHNVLVSKSLKRHVLSSTAFLFLLAMNSQRANAKTLVKSPSNTSTDTIVETILNEVNDSGSTYKVIDFRRKNVTNVTKKIAKVAELIKTDPVVSQATQGDSKFQEFFTNIAVKNLFLDPESAAQIAVEMQKPKSTKVVGATLSKIQKDFAEFEVNPILYTKSYQKLGVMQKIRGGLTSAYQVIQERPLESFVAFVLGLSFVYRCYKLIRKPGAPSTPKQRLGQRWVRENPRSFKQKVVNMLVELLNLILANPELILSLYFVYLKRNNLKELIVLALGAMKRLSPVSLPLGVNQEEQEVELEEKEPVMLEKEKYEENRPGFFHPKSRLERQEELDRLKFQIEEMERRRKAFHKFIPEDQFPVAVEEGEELPIQEEEEGDYIDLDAPEDGQEEDHSPTPLPEIFPGNPYY